MNSQTHSLTFDFESAEPLVPLVDSKEVKKRCFDYSLPELYKKAAAEAVGTYFLCSTIALSVILGSVLTPLAIGLSLTVMVFALGHISDAHFNPAVTFAVFLRQMGRGKFSRMDACVYVIAQLSGAFVGALQQRLVIEDWCTDVDGIAIVGRSCVSGFPSTDPNVSPFSTFMIEATFTFALALVVLNVATTKANKNNSFYGLAIGMTVTAGAVAGGSLSGGAFNPAVGTALPVIHGEGGLDVLLYWLAPLVGAGLAAGFFKLTAKEEDFY